MLILDGTKSSGQRAEALGGLVHCRTPNWVLSELQKARRPFYGLGLTLEMLADFERVNRCPAIRTPEMLRAGTLLLNAALPLTGGFNALTPQMTIQSRTCQLWVRCDLEPTMRQDLRNLNPAPVLIIRGSLTQRFGMRIEVDAVGSGALGNTALKISFDNGATFPYSSANGTAYLTTATITQLYDNGNPATGHPLDIWLSCGVGPYDAGDIWISTLGALADQAGTGTNRDFINSGNNTTTPSYQANTAAIRNRASMSTVAADSPRFLSLYTPPDPGTTPSLVTWVGNAVNFVNTGRLWGTGDVNQFCVRQANPSPTIGQAGAVAENSTTAMTVGTWFGCEAYFADSNADRMRIGTTAVAAAPAGGCQSGVPTGLMLFSRGPNAALPSTYAFSEFAIYTGGDATAGELARDRARRTLFYGVAA